MANAKSAIPMSGPVYEGEIKGDARPGDDYAKPYEPVPKNIKGMDSLMSESLDRPGFQTDGYITKKGMCYGEGAKFNYLPPGMDITNQEYTDQRNMKLKRITNMGYEGDGWGSERDIPE